MAELLVLRVVHVVGGVFWVGSGLFTAFFLMPALATAGPTAGAVMGALAQRRLFVVLPVVALLTIASGLRLMWIVSGGFAPAWFATARGGTFAASGLAAMLAFVISLLVSRPTAVRAAALSGELQRAADDAARATLSREIGSLRRRGAIAGNAALLLLVASAVGMAVARYLN